jgi:hypothetical protein
MINSYEMRFTNEYEQSVIARSAATGAIQYDDFLDCFAARSSPLAMTPGNSSTIQQLNNSTNKKHIYENKLL